MVPEGRRLGLSRSGHPLGTARRLFSVAASLVMVMLPGTLIGWFLDVADTKNAQVIALAKNFLSIAALFQIADGVQAVASGMLRGLKDARVPMLYALLGYWGLGLPLGARLAFPGKLGGFGIWIGLATGLAIVACLMIRRWMQRHQLGLSRFCALISASASDFTPFNSDFRCPI